MSEKPNGNGTNATMTEQEVKYLVQVLTTRPLGEALDLWLKMTGQEVVKVGSAPPAPHA